jgi:hypothetical protein
MRKAVPRAFRFANPESSAAAQIPCTGKGAGRCSSFNSICGHYQSFRIKFCGKGKEKFSTNKKIVYKKNFLNIFLL